VPRRQKLFSEVAVIRCESSADQRSDVPNPAAPRSTRATGDPNRTLVGLAAEF
jgi:hypothetical protein